VRGRHPHQFARDGGRAVAAALRQRSYNVAAIGATGSTISTQLWNVDPNEPLRVVRAWTQDAAKHLTLSCPVVIAPHDGDPVFMTVGEVLDFYAERT